MLREAGERGLVDPDALTMLEGVLEVGDLQVRDIMIPRAQMVFVRRDDPFSQTPAGGGRIRAFALSGDG